MVSSVSAETVTSTARWEAVLDELETDIQRTHQLLVRPPTVTAQDSTHDAPQDSPGDDAPALADLLLAAQWVPPTDLGPLPDALRGRAEAVVNQQRVLTATLNETLVTTRAHLRVADTLRRRNAPQAVYLDTLG